MTIEIVPLNEKQLNELPQNIEIGAKPFRIMCRGKSVNICTGHRVGGNVIYQMFYWDRPKEFVDMVVEFLKDNNPSEKFRVQRSE